MRIDSEDRIYIRQSWLGDALLCPERARLIEQNPDLKRYNDSAAMGTAVHSAIEQVLNNTCTTADIGEAAVEAFRIIRSEEIATTGNDIRITNTDPAKWNTHIFSMAEAWRNDIYPDLPLGGKTEFQFAVQVGEIERYLPTDNGDTHHELWFEGTMDYITKDAIYDWKTAARKYSQYEKQNQNVQSSVYCKAAVNLGLCEWPVSFNFGVMQRNASSTGQVVTVERTRGHGKWIVEQATNMANMVLAMQTVSPSTPWVTNDQHFLCSLRWCPVYQLCKGRYIGGNTDEE